MAAKRHRLQPSRAGDVGLFDRVLSVAWPASLLGDFFPELRAMVGFI